MIKKLEHDTLYERVLAEAHANHGMPIQFALNKQIEVLCKRIEFLENCLGGFVNCVECSDEGFTDGDCLEPCEHCGKYQELVNDSACERALAMAEHCGRLEE